MKASEILRLITAIIFLIGSIIALIVVIVQVSTAGT
jgi:hypothetical protein